MIKFHEFNINPKNKKTSDCVVRTLATATSKDYWEVFDELYVIAKKTGFMINDKKCYEKWLEQNGFRKEPQPRKENGKKYTISELIYSDEAQNAVLYHTVVIKLAHHLTCIKNCQVIDTWDCREEIVGNYWVKTR